MVLLKGLFNGLLRKFNGRVAVYDLARCFAGK